MKRSNLKNSVCHSIMVTDKSHKMRPQSKGQCCLTTHSNAIHETLGRFNIYAVKCTRFENTALKGHIK